MGPLIDREWQGTKVNYILTIMDGFTKWAEAIPMGDTSAQTVATAVIEQWVSHYGIPDSIHTDQGAQFTSELYREVMRLLNVETTVTPPYNPRSNKVERLHRILGDILRSDDTGPMQEWAAKLPLVMFAHRTAVSTVTGVSPFKAMFGVNSRIPLDVIFPTPREMGREEWPEYVEKLKARLQEIYAQILENTKLGVERATAYQSGKVTDRKSVV